MSSPLIKYCPVTGNMPMRCTRAGFEASCKKMQELERNSYGKITSRTDQLTKYCSVCLGNYPPDNITFLDMKNFIGEEMAASKYIDGKCDSCGGKKKITAHLGKMVCSSCMSFRIGCKNAPELVVAALREFGHMPVVSVTGPAAESEPCKDCEEWANIELDQRLKLKEAVQQKVEFVEKIQVLEECLLAACNELERHKKEVVDLERVVEVLKDQLRAGSNAPVLDAATKSIINDLAWKLADGLLIGNVTGIGIEDIRTIRGLAE